MRLENRIAIVTGGSRGMGRAYCLGLAREGATVVVNYRDRAGAAEEVVQEIRAAGGHAVACQADVGAKAEVEAMVDFAVKEFGRLDVMVSNAGIVHKQALLEHSDETIDRVLRTNVKGNIFSTQAAARVMMPQESGKIILCASIVAVVGEPLLSVYTASKGAILAFMRAAAWSWRPIGSTSTASSLARPRPTCRGT